MYAGLLVSDGFLDNIEYDLVGSPCEQVLAGEPQLYSERVADRFPLHAEDLRALGVESYLAIPVFDSNNRVLGHLAAMDDKPMPSRPRDMSIFRIFGVRVADDWSQALHSDP